MDVAEGVRPTRNPVSRTTGNRGFRACARGTILEGMPAPTSGVPTPVERPSPRPARRGDAIIWRTFAAVALPLGIVYFFVGPDPETIIYQAFSFSA